MIRSEKKGGSFSVLFLAGRRDPGEVFQKKGRRKKSAFEVRSEKGGKWCVFFLSDCNNDKPRNRSPQWRTDGKMEVRLGNSSFGGGGLDGIAPWGAKGGKKPLDER